MARLKGAKICNIVLVPFRLSASGRNKLHHHQRSRTGRTSLSSTSSFTHTFIRQILHQSITFILISLSSISITQFRQYNTNLILHSTLLLFYGNERPPKLDCGSFSCLLISLYIQLLARDRKFDSDMKLLWVELPILYVVTDR